VKNWIASLAGTALILAPALAAASDESDVLRSRAVRLIRSGDCASAVPLLQRSLAADAREARAGLLAGRCLIAQRRYSDAEAALLDTAERDPGLAGVQLQLAIARYHRDDFAGARSSLEAARPQSAGDAQFELYDALVLMSEERRDDALLALERARSADSASVEPVASYFEGVAASREGEAARARGALERVSAADPNGPWGDRARRQLDTLGRGLRSQRWFAGTVGLEWDSNSVLRGEGVDLPDGRTGVVERIDHDRDARMVWRLNGGIEALRTLNWSAGAMLSYNGGGFHDSDQFDYHSPVGSLWVDRHLSERTTVHMQYDGGYAWANSKSWYDSHNLGPALFHDWGNGHQTRLFGRAYFWDFRFNRREEAGDTAAEAEYRDRDGHGLSVGAEHVITLNQFASDVYAGVQGTKYKARGPEYSNRALETWVGTRTKLPAEFFLTARAGFAYRPYNHRTSFADPGEPLEGKKRSDHVKRFEIGVERALGAHTSGALRWSWVDSASNVDVFDFDRNILGAYFSARFE